MQLHRYRSARLDVLDPGVFFKISSQVQGDRYIPLSCFSVPSKSHAYSKHLELQRNLKQLKSPEAPSCSERSSNSPNSPNSPSCPSCDFYGMRKRSPVIQMVPGRDLTTSSQVSIVMTFGLRPRMGSTSGEFTLEIHDQFVEG